MPYTITHDWHTAVEHKNKMYIFGGYIKGERTNDVYCYDKFTQHWIKVEVNQPMPKPAEAN